MRTLDLTEAAEFLRIHPHTLERLARNRQIPGAKPGKRWVFLDIDLADWLRAQYQSTREEPTCHSTSAAASGGAVGRSAAKRLQNLLAQPTAPKRRNTTTGAAPNSGDKVAWIKPPSAPGKMPA